MEPLSDHTHTSALLAGKARVTPSKGCRTPRSEVNGLVILSRLITAILDGPAYPVQRITMIGNSECTIAAYEYEEGILKPWISHRIREIQEHINAWPGKNIDVGPLFHTPGSLNIADLETRGETTLVESF